MTFARLIPILVFSLTATAAEPIAITVDWKATEQTIVGFGGTIGWIHPNPRHKEAVYDLLFKELGVSVLRVQALGGEGGDESTPEPANDNGDPKTFDWAKFSFKETEARGAATIKAAQEHGVKTIIPVTWSPPGWMKSHGKRAGNDGQLKEGHEAEVAELWLAYVLAMKRDFGIDIKQLSIQNEPDLTYYYPTCYYWAGQYAATVEALRKRLADEKLDVRVLGPDTCRLFHMPEYVEAQEKLKPQPGAPILTHLYDLAIPYEAVDKDPARWRAAKVIADKYKRPLWLMETSNFLSRADPGSYEEALIWAQKIHSALADGNCEVVCYWQLFFDKKGEGLVYCEKSEAEKYEITPKFYTSMNYFKFVRPGMQRCKVEGSTSDVLVTAFTRVKDPLPSNSRVIVAINTSDKAQTLNFKEEAAQWSRYLTTKDIHCEEQGGGADINNVQLPPRSVTTLFLGGD